LRKLVIVAEEGLAGRLRGLEGVYGLVAAPGGRVEDEVLSLLRGGVRVVGVYPGAWEGYPGLLARIVSGGLNPYVYSPVDPLEARLAPALGLAGVVKAKAAALLAGRGDRARRGLRPGGLSLREALRDPGRLNVYYPAPVLRSAEACLNVWNCFECNSACPRDAIKGKPPQVDLGACTGCGLCTWACPGVVLEEPGFELGALEYLFSAASAASPGHVIFACRTSLPALARELERVDPRAWNIIVVPVDCPGWVTPHHAIQALAWGFDVTVACDEGSLEACGALPPEGVLEGVPASLAPVPPGEAAERVSRPPRSPGVIVEAPAGKPRPLVVRRVAEAHGVRRLRLGAPLMGLVRVDEGKCLLCDACSASCPYEALKLEYEGEEVRLVFRHERCAACRYCVAACTHGALTLEYEYDADLYGAPVVLARDRVARCRRCGAPLGSMRMLRYVEERLRRAGASELVLKQLWLCPRCKLAGLAEDDSDGGDDEDAEHGG